jgi:UDP-2,3-diacylglucosamine hydrolase
MSNQHERVFLNLPEGKRVYFASDFHLGAPNHAISREREDALVLWLQECAKDAGAVVLVGDLFDFWYEYKHVVPKGFVRFLAGIAKLADEGIPVYAFTGNHDIWMFGYLEEELGVKVFTKPVIFEVNGIAIFCGHGDGLGPGDKKFKILKKVFTFPLFQWLFKWLHPDIGISIAQLWSRHSRTDPATERFHGVEREWLYQYALLKVKTLPARYFVFGHRHLPLEIPLGDSGSTYINLGDWLYNRTFMVYDGHAARLQKFESYS